MRLGEFFSSKSPIACIFSALNNYPRGQPLKNELSMLDVDNLVVDNLDF